MKATRIQLLFLAAAVAVAFSCADRIVSQAPQPTELSAESIEHSADLVIEDMFYTERPTKEFVAYDLHVIVKNVGSKATVDWAIPVKAWRVKSAIQGMVFEPLPPVAQTLGELNSGQTKEFVWESIPFGTSYYIAVVDIPTAPPLELGREVEKPVKHAEKNNARGIPGPQ